MKLQAVFWDYPQFLDENFLAVEIKKSKDQKLYDWFLGRFLERGRVVDTLKFFSIQEISQKMTQIKLTSYTKKKWTRLVEVYDSFERK